MKEIIIQIKDKNKDLVISEVYKKNKKYFFDGGGFLKEFKTSLDASIMAMDYAVAYSFYIEGRVN